MEKLKKEFKYNYNGITLIALVVTIVVLLILAGISLNLVLGNNGLIEKAKEAKVKTETATWDERKQLIILGAKMHEDKDIISYLTKEFKRIDSSALVTDLGNGYYIKCTDKKFIYDYDFNEYVVNEGNDEDWIYTEDSNGNLTLIGCKNIYDGIITIPNFINGKPVKIIGQNIFWDNTDLLEVEISYGVNEIDEKAFNGCSNLHSIEFTTSITEIGKQAFYGCSQMTGDITDLIPNLNSINSGIFWGCSNLVGDIKIKNGIDIIGYEAFRGCSGLNGTLYIPSSVVNIEDGAFLNCQNLKGDITNIIKNLDYITANMFFDCKKLTGSIIIKEGIEQIETNAFKGCVGLDGDIILPNSLKIISVSAFENCTGIRGTLVLKNNVINIQDYAFYNCNQISSIKYSGSQTEWNKIDFGINNHILSELDIEYNYLQ